MLFFVILHVGNELLSGYQTIVIILIIKLPSGLPFALSLHTWLDIEWSYAYISFEGMKTLCQAINELRWQCHFIPGRNEMALPHGSHTSMVQNQVHDPHALVSSIRCSEHLGDNPHYCYFLAVVEFGLPAYSTSCSSSSCIPLDS